MGPDEIIKGLNEKERKLLQKVLEIEQENLVYSKLTGPIEKDIVNQIVGAFKKEIS